MRRLFVTFALVSCVVTSSFASAAEKAPPFTDVVKLVAQYFEKKPDYKPEDILTRRDVQPLLNQLAQLGLQVESPHQSFDHFLPDNNGLVQWLRSPVGRPVMRHIANLPGAYDRLDRLSWFPEGQKLMQKATAESDLIAAFTLLVSDATAHKIEATYAHLPLAQDFTVGTGRVYTQAQLVEHLRTLHVLRSGNFPAPGH